MRISLLIIITLCSAFFIGCKHPITKVPTVKFFHINVDSSQDFIDLKLSDLADSFRLVRLETSDRAIINANDYYVSEKYIIAFSQDGIYKFSSDGKFIKKIISWGRGPDEISGFLFGHFYDEKNDLLYIDDVNLNKKLLVYDLNLEIFLSPIKKAIEGSWGSFAIYNDSLIIGKSPSYSAEPYALFFQTFNGKFVYGIPNVKKRLLGQNPEETFQSTNISIGKNIYRVSFELDDTLFTLKNNHLVPYISLDFNNPRERPPNAVIKKGDREISFPKIEASSFLIIGVSIIDEIIWETPTAGRSKKTRKYLFFNKSTGKYSNIRTYVDNFSGVIQSPNDGSIKFPLVIKNGKLVVIYQPQIVKQIVYKGLDNTIFSTALNEELLKVSQNLQETDNPILLIGRIKEKI
jgi:hypothetical protein